MKIIDVKAQKLRYQTRISLDSEGHNRPGPPREAQRAYLTIVAENGMEGHSFGGKTEIINKLVRPMLIGEDLFYRERIWQHLKGRQRMYGADLSNEVLCMVDLALWDLAGQVLNQPVYKILGGFRNKIPAYASTMCGDDLEGGLDSPESYANFAAQCQGRGYRALKLHTWMSPPDVKRDVAACQAVRERVGPGMVLMLDSYHGYSRQEALYLGKELEKLGFYWLEEPMDEYSVSSYVWLAEQLDIPLCGPEKAEGKLQTRAEWIVRHASDISRGGVKNLGGLTPLMKTAHLCESFGVAMEVHGSNPGNLHGLAAMGIPGEYYERGLLHPFLDYEIPDPWLNTVFDPMDEQGYVHLSDRPGLGWDLNFDYIKENLVD